MLGKIKMGGQTTEDEMMMYHTPEHNDYSRCDIVRPVKAVHRSQRAGHLLSDQGIELQMIP